MTEFNAGYVPTSVEEVPRYLSELGRRLEEYLNFIPLVNVVEDADMSNSWVNFSAALTVRYWLDREGVVHLSGNIKTGTIGLAAFTLPVGFRPDFVVGTNLVFTVRSAGAVAVVTISDLGVVIPTNGNNTFVTLDGITFKAA